MHTPKDEEHYLRRDFDKNFSQSGVPFLAASCYEGCGNYLIYGHNIKNGSMFASLLFYADQEYWAEHPVIRFDTLVESGEYEVIAAFYSQTFQEDVGNVFRYYQYTDLGNYDRFAEYVKQVQCTRVSNRAVKESRKKRKEQRYQSGVNDTELFADRSGYTR